MLLQTLKLGSIAIQRRTKGEKD